jgi:hypothetical protein
MVKVAGWLSGLVVVAWVFLMADVQSNVTDDRKPVSLTKSRRSTQ